MSEIQRQLDALPLKTSSPTLGGFGSSLAGTTVMTSSIRQRWPLIFVTLIIIAISAIALRQFQKVPATSALLPTVAPSEVETQNADAVRRFQQNPESSVALFRELAAKHPEVAGLEANIGAALFASGHLSEAEDHLNAALALAANDNRIHNLIAAFHIARGQFQRAQMSIDKVIENDDSNLEAFLNLGILNEKIEQWNNAEEAYREYLLKTSPQDPRRTVVQERLRFIKSLAYHQNKTGGASGSVE